MPDRFTKKERSRIMAKIRSKGSKMECKMKAALELSSLEFEYQPKMFGKPDFLVEPNIAIFCDSSFWHGRNWQELRRTLPQGYWQAHIARNRERDRTVSRALRKLGYCVLRFWEEEIYKDANKCVKKISEAHSKIARGEQ